MKYSRPVLTTIVVLAVQVLAITAAPFSSNVYDKFRGNTYSNKGLLSESDELQLASQYHQQLLQQNRLVTDRRVVDYVNRVGRAVAARSQRPDLDYHFYVNDSDQINAFTVGGGRVYVYTGLVRRLNSEGQLAAVLGHEIGHNVGRHGLKALKGSQKWNFLILSGYVLGGQGGAGLASLFASGVILKHSRDSEREADFLGLYEMRDAGYDIEEMDATWRILETAERSEPSSFDKIFASHPPARERLSNTETEIQQHLRSSAGHGKVDTPEFDQVKALLGGGRVNHSNRRRSDDNSDNQQIYTKRKRSKNDRQTEDSTTARRQDEPRPPVLGGEAEDESNSLPFIDEARTALKKNGFQGAKVVGT